MSSSFNNVFNNGPGFSGFLKKNRRAILIFTACMLVAYGLKLFNVVLGKDTEAIIAYPDGLYNSWISIERFGLVYLKKILGIYQFNPYFAMAMMFVCMILGACIWQYLISRLTPYPEKYHIRSWILPAVWFTSPLMASQLGFLLQTFEVTLAFIMVALSLLLIWQFMEDKRILKAVFSVILLAAALSCYQGLAPLYIAGSAATFLLYAHRQGRPLRPVLILIAVLAAALAVYFLADKAAHAYTQVASDPYISDMILWKTQSVSVCINNILGHIKHSLAMKGSYYTFAFPFGVLCGILSVAAAWKHFKKNRVIYTFAMLIVFASPYLMTVLNGQEAYYRTQFVMPFAAGFLIQYFAGYALEGPWKRKAGKAVSAAVCVICIGAVFAQLVTTTRMYYSEYESCKEDEMLALKLSMRIDELGLGEYPAQPVMIVGAHQGRLNPSASTEWDFEGHSFFNWYYTQQAGNSIALSFMRTMGFDYHVPLPEQADHAVELAADMPVWPDEGCVKCEDGIIIVHMS